jgi:CRP/FNR family transcriptional regulator
MLLLGRLTAEERVGRFLLARAASSRRRGRSDQGFELPMSRGDIADFLGLTTETVSRVFTRLRQKGLITYDAATHVVLRNRPALAALAEGG